MATIESPSSAAEHRHLEASNDHAHHASTIQLTLRLPQGFQFECPLCRSHTFTLAMRTVPWSESAIYKCGGCHFHFSDPEQYPKTGAEAALKAAGRNTVA